MSTFDKYFGSGSKIGKAADKVARAAGGGGIVDYAGGKGSKKDAIKSAAKVGLTIASLTPIGRAAKFVGTASKAKRANRIIENTGNAVGRMGGSYKPYRGWVGKRGSFR